MKKRTHLIVVILLIFQISVAQSNYSTPQKITMYWDISLSMKNKDLVKEFELLDSYFSILQNVEVELVPFSTTIDTIVTYTIVNADWSSLKSALQNTRYDGVAFYQLISKPTNTDVSLLFTDGFESIDELIVNTKKPTFIVNSNSLANHRELKKQGILSQGNYINLNNVTIEQSMSLLKVSLKNIPINHNKISTTQNSLSKKELIKNKVISGIVSGPEGVLKEASILVIGKPNNAITDENGSYKVTATKGDTLLVSFVGMYTQKIVIEASTLIDISLEFNPNDLEEIVVKGRGKRTVDEDEVEETAYGKVKKKRLGYAVQSINSDDIKSTTTEVTNIIQGKFSVSNAGSNDDISKMITRGFISINYNSHPLIVIDNTPLAIGNANLRDLVNPTNVESITILKGLAATNRWGSDGAGGVVLITTKTATFKNISKNKPYDRAKKRDNNYTEKLILLKTSVNKVYLKELKKSKTLGEVYNRYLKQRDSYSNDLFYFIHVSDYIAQWGNRELSSKILSNILEIDVNNANLLKLVAYKAEQNYDYVLARKAYEKISKIRPKDAQSYRDLALIYQETGYYQKALNIYNDILDNKIPDVDFSGLQKNIDSELRRLISLHKKELDVSKIPAAYLNTGNYDARIVFNWNDVNAEFELQFVNPQKLFFIWSHTKSKNGLRIIQEKKQGFNSEEFLLIDAPKGEWLINIENKTRKSVKKPIVIKYTVYHNYGKANETKELKTIILNTISKKQMIGKIVI